MKRLLPIPVLLLAGFSAPASAHGTMEVPINRTYVCFKEGAESPQSAACIEAHRVGGSQALYNWNGINQNPPGDNHPLVVPDGKLCSGGQELYKGFDLLRTDWLTSNIVPDANGNFQFVYNAAAPHATKYFRFYVTRNGWNPAQPLKWSDLELFATVNGTPKLDDDRRYRMTVKLPAGKTGRHIIYNVWKRSDSEEAFYSCSDVVFGGGSEPPPASNPWKEAGSLIAHESLPDKSTVTLRLFSAQGKDVERHTVTLNTSSGQAANWPYELAVKVNAGSAIARIGVISNLQGNVQVNPVRTANGNRVYLNDGYIGHQYAIDIEKASTPPPAGVSEWQEGGSYVAGQLVSYQGKRYRCLVNHTAWKGSGWTPAGQPTLWQAVTDAQKLRR